MLPTTLFHECYVYVQHSTVDLLSTPQSLTRWRSSSYPRPDAAYCLPSGRFLLKELLYVCITLSSSFEFTLFIWICTGPFLLKFSLQCHFRLVDLGAWRGFWMSKPQLGEGPSFNLVLSVWRTCRSMLPTYDISTIPKGPSSRTRWNGATAVAKAVQTIYTIRGEDHHPGEGHQEAECHRHQPQPGGVQP